MSSAPDAGKAADGDAAKVAADKAAADAVAAAKKPEVGTPAPGVVPEKYELKLADQEIDAELLAEFTPLAKELKLDNATAQKIADLGAKIQKRTVDASMAAHMERIGVWQEAVRSDKELGGDKLGENMAVAKGAVLRFGGEPLMTALKDTGFENHPDVIRAFVKIGRAMKDDNFAANLGEGGGEKPDTAAQWYNADGSPKR
jgi:hypothetical protein